MRTILGIKWQDYVSYAVLKKVSLPSTESILLQVQLCWAGPVTRPEDMLMSVGSKKENAIVVLKKALQRPAEETACTSGNQPSCGHATGGL